ncbi:MAG TPA: transporter substrate-binding domain-containing protein [Dissulfurispiraceae bacterium]
MNRAEKFAGTRCNAYFLACLLAFVGCVCAAAGPANGLTQPSSPSSEKVIALVPRNVPPTYFLDRKTGKPAGFAIDIMDRIAERAGLRVEYKLGNDWSDVIARLRRGEADLIPDLGITEERSAYLLYGPPLEAFQNSFFVRAKAGGIQKVGAGNSVGVLAGSIPHHTLQKNPSLRVVAYKSYPQALFELLAGEIDALAGPIPTILHLARESGVENKIKDVGPPFDELKRGIAVRQDSPLLLERLNKATEGFIGGDVYRRIYAKWYGKPIPFWTSGRIVAASGALLLLSIITMGGWRYISMVKLNRELVKSIEERKKTEEEMRRIEAQLFQARKMESIGQLAGGIAHDFNNILSGLLGYIALIRVRMKDNEALMAYMDHVHKLADRAANLTQGLLAFSRKQMIDLRPEDINRIIRDFHGILERLIGEDIEFRVHLSDAPLVVQADKRQIEHVLMNLAANARDAMPVGGKFDIRSGRMEMDNEFINANGFGEAGPYALVSVSDEGTGMDKDTQQHIFEPFFTTKEVGKGTGLGLATVYGTVKQHNGYITVSSDPGQGATFDIYLPLVAAEPEEDSHAMRLPLLQGDKTILLIEDDESLRWVIKETLEAFGYKVVEATDGEDAVETFRKHDGSIHLIVSDVVMPKRNGCEVLEEIRKTNPRMKALFISGYPADILDNKKLTGDGVGFMHKPMDPRDLLRKIQEIL